MTQRIYAIPDIHGRLDLLNVLLLALGEQGADLTRDKFIVLGDMIDRGHDSKGVIDVVRKLTLDFPENVVALAGNHEWLMIDAVSRPADPDAFYLWMVNGGDKTLRSYGAPEYWGKPSNVGHMLARVPDEDVKWMASLPLWHEEPGFFFSHAPVPTDECRNSHLRGRPWTKNELIWTYHHPEDVHARSFDNGVVGVCGHVHALQRGVKEPRLYPHYIFADAGAGCSPEAPLVAIEVQSREVTYAWPTVVQSTLEERRLAGL